MTRKGTELMTDRENQQHSKMAMSVHGRLNPANTRTLANSLQNLGYD